MTSVMTPKSKSYFAPIMAPTKIPSTLSVLAEESEEEESSFPAVQLWQDPPPRLTMYSRIIATPDEIREYCQSEKHLTTQKLFGNEIAQLFVREMQGATWYDLFEDELKQNEEAVLAEYRATATQRESAAEAARIAFRQRTASEIVAAQARRGLKRGEQVEKKQQPCSRLYSCQGNKHTGGARPTTMHVSSECWSHERMDPLTGKIVAEHVCPWLHPGEAGWCSEWETNRLWRPSTPPTNSTRTRPSRFADLAPSSRM